MSKYLYERIDQIVDKETGVLDSCRSTSIRKVTAEHFIKVYLKDLSGYLGLDSITHFKVLAEIWIMASYETNQIILIKAIKEKIARKLNLAVQTVNNAIIQLHKKGILIRENKSMYILNPKDFFKGDEIQRAKVIQKVIQYNFSEEKLTYKEPKL